MINKANVWRVILHNSVMDSEGIKISNKFEKEKKVLEYFLKNDVVAIGWPIDEKLEDTRSFAEYRKRAEGKYKTDRDYNTSVINFGGGVQEND